MLRKRPTQDDPTMGAKAPNPRNSKGKATSTSSSMQIEDIAPQLGDAKASLSQRQRKLRSSHASPPTDTSSSIRKKSEEEKEMEFKDLSRKSQWIALAAMSGACASFNGVFAKLTTTELTTTFATGIANAFGLGNGEKGVEVVVRGIFFALNLLFNFIMWTLFTKALSRGTSTTQVSILNTSTNFLLTAILGFLIFSESLPPLWFLGAGLLVAGNVIIGRREEEDGPKDQDVESRGRDHGRGDGEEERLLRTVETEEEVGELVELECDLEDGNEERGERKEGGVDDALQLGDDHPDDLI
ncbi:hypothetical protein BGZ60DRAFT_525701 [Tricladium varicosporioides]|nr:hypothetical protein BGZ60DRAFT_525701 [Hymenoscyphus varicosporioides]